MRAVSYSKPCWAWEPSENPELYVNIRRATAYSFKPLPLAGPHLPTESRVVAATGAFDGVWTSVLDSFDGR